MLVRKYCPGARRWAMSADQKCYVLGADLNIDCLSSLENSQTRARYINVASSYDGTFQWLFDREIVPFVDWLEEDQNMIGPSRPFFFLDQWEARIRQVNIDEVYDERSKNSSLSQNDFWLRGMDHTRVLLPRSWIPYPEVDRRHAPSGFASTCISSTDPSGFRLPYIHRARADPAKVKSCLDI